MLSPLHLNRSRIGPTDCKRTAFGREAMQTPRVVIAWGEHGSHEVCNAAELCQKGLFVRALSVERREVALV